MLLYYTGFEEQAFDQGVTVQASPQFVAGRRAGSTALRLNNVAPGATFPTVAGSGFVIGFGLRWNSTSAPGTSDFLVILNGTTTHLSLRFTNTGQIVLLRNGTVLATSTLNANWPDQGYRYVEMKAIIAGSGGSAIVKVDGVEWINYTGNTANGTASANSIRLLGIAGAFQTDFDDLVIMDTTGAEYNTFQGDLAVETVYPSGNGSTSGNWTGSDGDKVDNYLLVDEAGVPSLSDYAAAAAGAGRELFALPPLPTVSADVLAVQTIAQVVASDAGTAPSVRLVARDGSGAVATGATFTPGTAAQQYAGPIRTTQPGGGAWSPAAFDALEVGIETT